MNWFRYKLGIQRWVAKVLNVPIIAAWQVRTRYVAGIDFSPGGIEKQKEEM